MMRALALALLCSCAPAAVSAPSSLPHVRVDTALPGAVVSVDAARALLKKRDEERALCETRIIGCEARAQRAEKGEAAANERAEARAWWQTYGPAIVLGSVVGALGAGFVIGFATGRR